MTSNDEQRYISIKYKVILDQLKDWSQKYYQSWENERNWRFCLRFWRKTADFSSKMCEIRSFSQLRRYFWFGSLLFDPNGIVIKETTWLNVIPGHSCPTLLIFRHFTRIFETQEGLKMTKNEMWWAGMTSNDVQSSSFFNYNAIRVE